MLLEAAHHIRQFGNLPVKVELLACIDANDWVGVPEEHAVKATKLALGPVDKCIDCELATLVVIERLVPKGRHADDEVIRGGVIVAVT